MEKAISFNTHINIAETAMAVSEYLGGPDKAIGASHVPGWVSDTIKAEKRGGWREFVIVELAPFIDEAFIFFELLSDGDCPCFYNDFIPAFFTATANWPHFRAQSARDIGVYIGQQLALNDEIPF